MIRFIDEYRDRKLISRLAGLIVKSATGSYRFMEVCGGHTASIHRFGIPSLLPENISLVSGPGCPVCVTGTGFIDNVIRLARTSGTIIAPFGDLMRIPGSESSLEKEKMRGADIRIVFSGLEALEIAESDSSKRVIFPGIGFETTAPGTAVTVREAERRDLKNFFLLSSHKLMPPAMKIIAEDKNRINGFICPGHVAAVTGSDYFSFLPDDYGTGCVISGFEPADILLSILMLVRQVNENDPQTGIEYKRAVTREGNARAMYLMNKVFEPTGVNWRGLGLIPGSGLKLKDEYGSLDAGRLIDGDIAADRQPAGCICGEILGGWKTPPDCDLFAGICTPENPVGACMVSNEGSCNSFYRYNK